MWNKIPPYRILSTRNANKMHTNFILSQNELPRNIFTSPKCPSIVWERHFSIFIWIAGTITLKEMKFQWTRARPTIKSIFQNTIHAACFSPTLCNSILYFGKSAAVSCVCFRTGCAAHSKWLLTRCNTLFLLLSLCGGANPFRHLIQRMKAAPWPGPITAPIVQLELRQLSASARIRRSQCHSNWPLFVRQTDALKAALPLPYLEQGRSHLDDQKKNIVVNVLAFMRGVYTSA